MCFCSRPVGLADWHVVRVSNISDTDFMRHHKRFTIGVWNSQRRTWTTFLMWNLLIYRWTSLTVFIFTLFISCCFCFANHKSLFLVCCTLSMERTPHWSPRASSDNSLLHFHLSHMVVHDLHYHRLRLLLLTQLFMEVLSCLVIPSIC